MATEIRLRKHPKRVNIIQGFPGFGLIGTIATEFLLQHLKCELIGKYWFETLPATVAIHNEQVVNPVGIYYNEKYNIVIIHGITAAAGIEWQLADLILKIAKDLDAYQIINLEGIASKDIKENPEVFFFSTHEDIKEKIKGLGITPLKEGIIMGVSSALMLKDDINLVSFFVEAHSELPDSKAAAELIKVIDKYLNLEVDTKPLLDAAKRFEKKLNELVEQSSLIKKKMSQKQLNYVG